MQHSTSCPEARRLRGLLEETLPPGEIDQLTLHVGDCRACQSALERIAAGGAHLPQVVCASVRQTPAPESAYWGALQSLEQGSSRSTPAPTQTVAIHEPVYQPAHPSQPQPNYNNPNGATAFLEPSPSPGHLGRLGHFEVLRVIGQGGMGMVLLAHDEQLQREVAIKVLDPRLASDPNARARFCREARAAAAVSDDHIVAVHQVSHEEERDLPYIVMQLVEGESLEQRISRDKSLPIEEIIRIGMQIASGLAAAHERGLIHRDIKPGNILLEKGTERVKITDFGLARATEDLRLTRSGMVAGTPLYMAPEQARGEGTDHRADLFSLGVVLYEMATGTPPFTGNTPLAVLKKLADDPHKPVTEVKPGLPEWLAELIDKLLQKRPEDRFQSAREVATLLDQHWVLHRTSSAELVACPRAKARKKMAQLMLVSVIGGVLLTLASLGLFMLLRPSLPGAPRPWATLGENQGPIRSVANAPDGLLFAIGTDANGVKLWNPSEERLVGTLPETRPVHAVAFSGDGKRLAVGNAEGQVQIYDVATQRLLLSLQHDICVSSVAFSADGTRLGSGTRKGQLTLWNLATGKAEVERRSHKHIYSVAFSPTQNEFASTGEDGKVIVWNAASGEPRLTIPNQGGGVWSLAYTPDGKILATGGWDGAARLWETGTGKLSGELRSQSQDIWSLSFCPGGQILATGSEDGSIRLWNVARQQERLALLEHKRTVYTVAITRDGKNLISGSRDGTARMWAIPPLCLE